MTSITIAQDETIDLTISQFSESIKKHVIAGDPEKSLYPQLIKVHHLMDLVRTLEDLRASAEGIVQLYTLVPHLESVDIEVMYRLDDGFGSPSRQYDCEFTNATVMPGALDEDDSLERYADELTDLFVYRYRSDNHYLPSLEDSKKLTLFDEDRSVLFSAADSEGLDFALSRLTVSTSREQIMAAINNANPRYVLDAVACALFPRRWKEVAERLGIPLDRHNLVDDENERTRYATARPRG